MDLKQFSRISQVIIGSCGIIILFLMQVVLAFYGFIDYFTHISGFIFYLSCFQLITGFKHPLINSLILTTTFLFMMIITLNIVDMIIYGFIYNVAGFSIFFMHSFTLIMGIYIMFNEKVLVLKRNVIRAGIIIFIYLLLIDWHFFARAWDVSVSLSVVGMLPYSEILLRLIIGGCILAGNFMVYRKARILSSRY